MSVEDFFIKGVRREGGSIRKRLVSLGVPYECSTPECLVTSEWLGSHITLQVDHIDGDNYNNEKDNLRFLCPNCHAQTETFGNSNIKKYSYCSCGRRKTNDAMTCLTCYNQENKEKIEWPPVEEIIKQVKIMGYVAYAETIGVSDNGVRKHLTRAGIKPLPKFR